MVCTLMHTTHFFCGIACPEQVGCCHAACPLLILQAMWNKSAKYVVFMFAGASQFHGHAQVMLSKVLNTAHMLVSRLTHENRQLFLRGSNHICTAFHLAT